MRFPEHGNHGCRGKPAFRATSNKQTKKERTKANRALWRRRKSRYSKSLLGSSNCFGITFLSMLAFRLMGCSCFLRGDWTVARERRRFLRDEVVFLQMSGFVAVGLSFFSSRLKKTFATSADGKRSLENQTKTFVTRADENIRYKSRRKTFVTRADQNARCKSRPKTFVTRADGKSSLQKQTKTFVTRADQKRSL